MIDIGRLLQSEKTLPPDLQYQNGLYPFGSCIRPKPQEHLTGKKLRLLQYRFVWAWQPSNKKVEFDVFFMVKGSQPIISLEGLIMFCCWPPLIWIQKFLNL